METQCRSLQGSCSNCQAPPHQLEVFNIGHVGDWREPYVSYLHDGMLPANKNDAAKMKQRAKRFVFHEGNLYRKSFGVHDNPRTWNEQLPIALWAYWAAPRISTGVSPYSLVYGADAILSAEIKILLARIAAASGVQWNEAEASSARIAELDTLDSKRTKAEEHSQAYRNRVSRAYDKAVKPRIFQVGDLVLKTAKHIPQDMSAPKFSPKWEGPYVVTKAYNSGYYKIVKEDGGKLEAVINKKWLKSYYA
ncbi:uncharacterized protein LOC113311617 [Papaver somniferum]|uniref:uncharacterized protein LOC113311617 n=1 Tax=Papaver somniferum TaxID=3469 RepID=UPI000E701719|nr:uncharacterized protein LOC113311617 [Papaver somniferum]